MTAPDWTPRGADGDSARDAAKRYRVTTCARCGLAIVDTDRGAWVDATTWSPASAVCVRDDDGVIHGHVVTEAR